jgi:hypothetical protein
MPLAPSRYREKQGAECIFEALFAGTNLQTLKRLALQRAAAIDGFVPAETDQRNRHQSSLEEFGSS